MELEIKLRCLLDEVRKNIPNNEFCGVGVVICSTFEEMPIASLCPGHSLPDRGTIAEKIADCSFSSHPCHDGFHILNEIWELKARNQYFAPFIEGVELNGNHSVGARYVTAQYGSLLKSVACTGVLSERDGLVVFVNGKPV